MRGQVHNGGMYAILLVLIAQDNGTTLAELKRGLTAVWNVFESSSGEPEEATP